MVKEGAREYLARSPDTTHGCRTIFSITPGGVYTQLYVLPGVDRESFPTNPLMVSGGVIYGKTSYGHGPVVAFTP